MPGANAQAAYHLNNAGYHGDADALRNTVIEDQLVCGAIPIRTWGDAETWPTIFLFLYAWPG